MHLGAVSRDREGEASCLAEWSVLSVGTCCAAGSPDTSPRRAYQEVSCEPGVSHVAQTLISGAESPVARARARKQGSEHVVPGKRTD